MQKRIVEPKNMPFEMATPSDIAAYKQYLKEKAEGKLIPWEQVKKELEARGVHVRRRAQ